MEPAADLIGTVPLFERLDASLRTRIEAITELMAAEPGQVLLHQGALPEFLYILLEGQVALSSTAADGTTALVEVLHPIDHFVLASVMTRLPYLMAARTVTQCRLLAVHADGLLDLVEHEAPLANALLRSVSREFRTMVRQVRDLKLRTAAQRLGCYLLARVKDGEAPRPTSGCRSIRGCWRRDWAAGRRICRAPLPRCARMEWRHTGHASFCTTSRG